MPLSVVRCIPYLLFAGLGAALVGYAWYDGVPYVVLNGDTADVASFVAAWLHPERFAGDLVLDDPAKYTFYISLVLPLAALLHLAEPELGRAFIYLLAPYLFAQAAGFYRLGMVLWQQRFYAAGLALLTLVPIWTIDGDLWGTHYAPLIRMMFAALFPWLVLLALSCRARPQNVYWLGLACGAAAYVHLVSGPSVAAALFLVVFLCKPVDQAWLGWTVRVTVGGLIFLACIAPYAYVYLTSFPSGSDDQLVQQVIAGFQPYMDVTAALAQWFEETRAGGVNWRGRGWPWLIAVAGLLGAALVAHRSRDQHRFVLLLVMALCTTSFGVAYLDQSLAALRGQAPVQLDVIRNARYVLPLLMVGFGVVPLLIVHLVRRAPEFRHAKSFALLVGWAWLMLMGFFARPYLDVTLPGVRAMPSNHLQASLTPLLPRGTQAALQQLRDMPAGTKVLPFASNIVALSPRYAARQPVVWTAKDKGMLLYANHPDLARWAALQPDMQRLRELRDVALAQEVLCRVLRLSRPDVMLVDSARIGTGLRQVLSGYEPPISEGQVGLYPVHVAPCEAGAKP